MHSTRLDHPRRGACVKARFAKSLQCSAEVGSGESERKQIRDTGQSATQQAEQESDFAPFTVGEWSREKAAAERYKRKNSDHESNGLIRSAQIVPDMRGQSRQHRTDSEKPEKRRSNERPKTRTEPLRRKTHVILVYKDGMAFRVQIRFDW
jgi:hypothetical protein